MHIKRPLYERLEAKIHKYCFAEDGDGSDSGDGNGDGGDGNNDGGGGRGNSLLNNSGDNNSNDGGDGGQGNQGDAKWYWSEGVPGEGEVPDWLQADKYKTADAQAKAYIDADKRLAQRDELRGAPENYELSISDEVKALIPEGEHEEWGSAPDWFLGMAKEFDMTNDQVNKLINAFNLNELGALPDPKEEATKLGSTANERINRVANFINTATKGNEKLSNLALKYTTTAEGIELFEACMKSNGAMNIGDGEGADDNTDGQITREQLKELMFAVNERGQRKMHIDPEYARMVNAKYKQFHGSGSSKRNIVDINPPSR